MAFETINLGTQPAGTGGDTARSAFEKTNRNFLAAEVLSATMSQAQFEAIRAQNKERYAASGWVSFGNHESGKQVNECKPGLYTVLSTPNTLRIGKAGGLGDSETDNASVHIDGVVFNLTNQFVLTLPSQPTSTQPERMDMYGLESEKVEISAASPNAYQGGLRGVGAAVNLFTATDQQKKDFFSSNANTTYIGTDGKIYQWQIYKVSFAGTTDGVPSPSEQGYSRNTLGDLWLKAGKNLLYFGNVLRLNDGGYHPSFNQLGAAKFVGDTFWYNTSTSISSKEDCFVAAKLLAGSGAIASAKSGRPDGRYYDAIYADGQGGVCRDMRYSAYGVDSVDFAEADQRVKNGTYRGFELVKLCGTEVTLSSNGDGANNYINAGRINFKSGDYIFTAPYSTKNLDGMNNILIDKSTKNIYKLGAWANEYHLKLFKWTGATWVSAEFTAAVVNAMRFAYYSYRAFFTGLPMTSFMWSGINSASLAGFIFTGVVYGETVKYSVGGSFFQTDVIGTPENILATPALANGWQGGWISVIPDGTSKFYELSRDCLSSTIVVTSTGNNGASFVNTGNVSFTAETNGRNASYTGNEIAMYQYQAFAKQAEIAPNAALAGLVPYNVFASSDYRPENGALLGESLIGKLLKNNSGVSVNNKSLSSCAIDGTGKLTSASSFDGVTHQAITLGAPANNSPAFKAVSYLANINQQAVPHFAFTELKHNGTNWGDDGKVTIVDNQATKTDLNGNTVLVGTAKLKEPIGWIKNKV